LSLEGTWNFEIVRDWEEKSKEEKKKKSKPKQLLRLNKLNSEQSKKKTDS
jgi:hypothetical protein